MPRSREILLPWDSQPQEWTGIDGEGLGAGLRRAINSAVLASVEQAEQSPITRLSGGSIASPIVAGDYGLAVQLDNALYNGIVQTPGWTDRTGEATFCLIFDRDAAGDTGCWELGGAAGDEFPFSAQAYFDVAWSSRWGNAINPPSGAGFGDRVVLHFCVKDGEQRAYWNGQLWHSNTATGGFGIPATLIWGKPTLKGKFYGGFGWERFLSAGEVAAHYALPWSPFAPQTIWVPVSAGGGGTTISATPGNAAADGTTASVKRTIPATPGNASASGTTASVVRVIGAAPGNAVADGTTAAVTRSIAATPGNAVADGVTATVTNSGTTTISCTPGNAAADGALAAITRTIAAAPGNAVANGAIAALLRVIATTPGNAVADGVTAAVQASVTISCTPGNAVADGVAATVTNGDAQGAGMGFSMSRMRRLVKIQFNGKLYQAFEEDIPELLETLEEQAEQKIKKKRNARAKPAPVATVVSAPADVLPSLQSRIDDVNHSIGVLWGVDEDEDEELLWLML